VLLGLHNSRFAPQSPLVHPGEAAMARRKRVRRIRIVRSLGRNWGKVLQGMVMKDAADQARFYLKSGKRVGRREVEVKIPVSVHIAFPRKGKSIAASRGVARCNCTYKEDETGSVCKCVGPDAASCDCLIIV
jgi:hypothetical protein